MPGTCKVGRSGVLLTGSNRAPMTGDSDQKRFPAGRGSASCVTWVSGAGPGTSKQSTLSTAGTPGTAWLIKSWALLWVFRGSLLHLLVLFRLISYWDHEQRTVWVWGYWEIFIRAEVDIRRSKTLLPAADTAIPSSTQLHQRFISKCHHTRGICPSPQQGIPYKACVSARELSTVLQKAAEPPLWSNCLCSPLCYAWAESSRSEHETGDTFNFKQLSHFSEV